MFWVFCNCCFLKPGRGKKRQFFMTSCSHILCSHCTRPDAKICKKCAAPCMIVQCNAQMPDEVKEVFADVTDNIPNLIKVLDYQDRNRTKLMAHYRSNKYKSAKVYISELDKKLNTTKQKYEACKIALNKQQNNIEILLKKYQCYKEKFGNIDTPSRTPVLSQMSSMHLNTSRNKLNPSSTPISGRQSVVPMNTLRTPINSYRTNPMNRYLTPGSVGSSRKSSNGSLTSSNIATLPGYTPPSESFELLSLFNKNK